jgi:class 3 adenylate cyclase
MTADAESRFLVLLRFDLVDSTGISGALSPSDELAFRRRYTEVVEALVDPDQVKLEWDGDGGLMVFGFPEVRVDAPEVAVRTGLRLIDVVRSIVIVRSVRPQVRVGIACGRVTIDKTRQSLATIKPVSRATRLMESADPGQLLVAEDTRRLVDRYFDYQDVGILELQGAGRRRVWRVLGETPVVSRFAARHADSPRDVVGREDILAQLSDAWSAALEGHGSAVCLVGDSGIGKSRLARVVLDWAERDAATVLEIDCTPSTGNAPLLPIGVLLRRLARIDSSASEADQEHAALSLLSPLLGDARAREHLTYLGPLLGMTSVPIPLDKTREQVRAAALAAIVEIVRAVAGRARLVVLCEDLHWADDTTAQAVQAVSQIVSAIPTLMLATRWPKSERAFDLDAICAGFTTIPVEPLPGVNAARLVRTVAGDGLSAAQVDDIVNRCGGVPLLLEEVTRNTLEQADAGATVRPAQPSDSSVPPELQLVVESRLELWPQLRGIIDAASVLGREFPMALLESMMAGRHVDIPSAISQFADLGLFAPSTSSPRGRASFKHALIRDAVYETIVGKGYVRQLHSDAANSLIKEYLGTPDGSPDILAQHLKMAERLGRRVDARERRGARGARTRRDQGDARLLVPSRVGKVARISRRFPRPLHAA